MKKSMACLSVLLLLTSGALAANDAKEVERVKEAGEVMKEILNIPDDIPQDLLDKAECVVVLPSVKKGATRAPEIVGSGGSSTCDHASSRLEFWTSTSGSAWNCRECRGVSPSG